MFTAFVILIALISTFIFVIYKLWSISNVQLPDIIQPTSNDLETSSLGTARVWTNQEPALNSSERSGYVNSRSLSSRIFLQVFKSCASHVEKSRAKKLIVECGSTNSLKSYQEHSENGSCRTSFDRYHLLSNHHSCVHDLQTLQIHVGA